MSEQQDEEFARRAGAALRASAESLDATTRSRLARARAAALAGAAPRRPWLTMPYLAPAGALASAALVTLLLITRGPAPDAVNEGTVAALYDLELLADADAFELADEVDLEFIEWAAGMAEMDGAGG